jgi:type VI secretion system protein ImpJ
MKRWAVNWCEGMALSPQHMQAADRHVLRRVGESSDWFHPFSHGLRRLELTVRHDEVALSECEARFKDGTTLMIPEDLERDSLRAALGPAFQGPDSVVTVYLAFPDSGQDRIAERWQTCDDESDVAGGLEVDVAFRLPKAELKLAEGEQPPVGYQALPLARLRRGSSPGSPPTIVNEYIPPLLVVDAWPTLTRRITDLASQVHSHVGRLAEFLVGRPLAINPKVPNDTTRVLKLMALSAVDAHLRAVCATPRLHPWYVFLELCRVAGQVAPFRAERLLAAVPEYRHEDLGGCFDAIIREIEKGLIDDEPPPYDVFAFKRRSNVVRAPLEVNLQSIWLREQRPIYLAVKSRLEAEDCLRLLRAEDLTIADRPRVERLHQAKRFGLDLKLPENLAPGLQAVPDLHFFEFQDIDEVWADAFAAGTLAIQVNPRHFEPRGDEEIVATVGGERFEFRFLLYVFHHAR